MNNWLKIFGLNLAWGLIGGVLGLLIVLVFALLLVFILGGSSQ